MSKLVEKYEYDVNPTGILTSVKIQSWKDSGELLSTQNLVLVGANGLKLKDAEAVNPGASVHRPE